MRKILLQAPLLVLSLIALALLAPIAAAMAQVTVTTGVVVEVTGSGSLTSFAVSDEDGDRTEFTVDADTVLALESGTGEEWQSTVGDAGPEALARLRDQRSRFAPVSVQEQGGRVTRVSEANSRNLSQNLIYILAAFIIAWGVLFAYIILVAQRQRKLQNDLKRLDRAAGGESEK